MAKGGIRDYIYSLDTTVNPSTYKPLDKPAAGASMPSEKSGPRFFGSEGTPAEQLLLTPNVQPTHQSTQSSRSQTWQHVVDTTRLGQDQITTCMPTFSDVRDSDAITQADEILTGERSLGVDATVVGSTPWGGGVRRDGSTVHLSARLLPSHLILNPHQSPSLLLVILTKIVAPMLLGQGLGGEVDTEVALGLLLSAKGRMQVIPKMS
ncbi:hypothetical protein PAXINDRAFT_16033 [Paxillus involutus ATCC 200175]|uniref:Uncharacterized protein n=1 Tax=Paxillus involutus ATCC 200175 TaxID=664439 RepID=A0A0C9TT20_PAXIN|nr:hypothetical protein PAXINDRAFT_16033 [Paxillus involutus ATCC 200175]